MKVAATTLVCLLVAAPALAADWKKVVDAKEQEVLLDTASVKSVAPDTVRFWYRTAHKSGNFTADSFIEGYCKERSYRILKSVWTEMKIPQEIKYPQAKFPVPAGSDIEAVLRAACAPAEKPAKGGEPAPD